MHKRAFLGVNIFAWMIILLGCNSNTPGNNPPTVEVANVVTDKPKADSLAVPDSKSEDPEYAILTNLEMIEYCLPYPRDGYAEDFDASEGKGNHVFVSKDKKSRLIYSGNLLDEEFLILYHDVQAEVQEITMKQPLHDEFAEDHFEISWKEGKKITWMKKWYRKGDEETVTARFEYPEDQSEAMKKVIAVVTSASTKCE